MEKLVVIDGNFWLFSCYYATAAMGNLMVNKDGVPTNAVYGFANRLESLLKQNPEYIVVAFDAKGKTFRSELLEEYKGTRKPTPDELVCQFSMIREYFIFLILKKKDMKVMILLEQFLKKRQVKAWK